MKLNTRIGHNPERGDGFLAMTSHGHIVGSEFDQTSEVLPDSDNTIFRQETTLKNQLSYWDN